MAVYHHRCRLSPVACRLSPVVHRGPGFPTPAQAFLCRPARQSGRPGRFSPA